MAWWEPTSLVLAALGHSPLRTSFARQGGGGKWEVRRVRLDGVSWTSHFELQTYDRERKRALLVGGAENVYRDLQHVGRVNKLHHVGNSLEQRSGLVLQRGWHL